MPYTQAIPFNQAKAGTTPLECLRNVRLGYGINTNIKFSNASASWNISQVQHRDRNVPAGCTVPLYYSYIVNGINEGHINVQLPNGTVWSDGVIYKSIDDYESKKFPRYLGWGENVNGIPVIKGVTMQLTPTEVDMLFKMCLGRPATEAELNNPDYQKNASVLTHTLWNNGGEARYENPTPGTATVLKPGNYKVN